MSTEILIDRYKVLERLGEGAMGAVWLVEDSASHDMLAMKVLSAQLEGAEKSYLQLKQEFRLMTQLRHPNCCAVYDYGQLQDGNPYLTMELVPGQGLDELLPLNATDFRAVISQLLLALGYVHQLGYVHCDIKSQNVRVRPDGVVKLMDYGLMEQAGRSGAPIKGTLAYMAPEVVKRGPIDQRADLYGVGALAYELLSGAPPFVSHNVMEVLRAHVSERPRPLSHVMAKVDPELERIVLKLLAKDPVERYQSAYEVLADLGVELPAGIGGNLLTSPLVGRDEPQAQIQAQLTAISKWEPGGTVLLTGPAGIGKSRMLEEFRYQVQMEGVLYASGAPTEQSSLPYGPVVQVLRRLLPALREHMPEGLEAHAPVLIKLMPELGAFLGQPELQPAPDLDPPAREKARLQATISELLVGLAQRRPLVIALEDWQWTDPLSAELLEYMLRNTKETSLLVLVASRGVPEAIAGWGERVLHVGVAPLDARSMWRMVTCMLGTEAIGTRFMTQIADFSAGNPAAIERLLEHLVRERILQSEAGRWNTQLELTQDQLPTDLGALLLAKLDDLGDDARAVARAAAVIGRRITLDLLQVVSTLPDNELFDAIAELQAAQVLEVDEEDCYRFSQEQLRFMLYDELAGKERTRLHAAAVAAIEHRIWGKSVEELAFEDVRALASHALKGNVPDKTIVYALEAGLRCLSLNAMVDAERFLSDGLALVRLATGNRWQRLMLDYVRFLSDVYRTTSKYPQARELLNEAIPLAQTMGKEQVAGRMLTSLAKCMQLMGDYEGALEQAQLSVTAAENTGDLVGKARALMTIGRIHFFKGRLAQALTCADEAAATGRASEDATILAAAFAMGGYFAVASGQPERLAPGIRDLTESLGLLAQTGDKIGLINSLSFMGNAQVMLGDFEDAWQTFSRVRALAYEVGSKDDEIVGLINLATTALELGHLLNAEERAHEARDLVDRRGTSKYARGLAVVVEALAKVMQGRPAKMRGLAQTAVDYVREIKNKYVEGVMLPFQMQVLVALGLVAEADKTGLELHALIEESGNKEPEGHLNLLLGELLGREGKLAEARTHAEAAMEEARTSQNKGMQVRAGRVLAWLAVRAGAWEEGLVLGRTALALAETIGAVSQAMELHGILGELALATGESPAEAERHFKAMERLAREADHRLVLPRARFWQAACYPCRPEAAGLVAEAQAGLRAVVEDLDAEDAAAFVSLEERAQVLGGDRHTPSLPRRIADRDLALRARLRAFYRTYHTL